jgi:ATP-binding cassette subfamily B protein
MAICRDLSLQVYERTLYQPYSVHISRNSSEILAGEQKARNLFSSIIQPMLIISSSLLVLIVVLTTLLAIKPLIVLSVILGFKFIYLVILIVTKYHISKNSQTIAIKQNQLAKTIQEGLGGIRDVLICGAQPMFSKRYQEALVPLQRALASNQVLAGIPRFGIEALGMVLIAGIAYVLVDSNGGAGLTHNVVAALGALALAAQRLFPILQQIYVSYITIKGNQENIQDALRLLDQVMPENLLIQPVKAMEFQKVISLINLSYRFNCNTPWVLRHVNIEMPKGSRVGFIGSTGSGKSTLIDIVLGLLTPSEGSLNVDDIPISSKNVQSWQANISYVPQDIYLADASIAENIAFGVPSELIDRNRLEQAAEQAQISKIIETWKDGYETIVGERGARLSGGQRQRIGIARAIYRRSSVMILDEATSALDSTTEVEVMKAMEALGGDITFLIVAHRLTTLKDCTLIVELANSEIKSIGSYEQMVRGNCMEDMKRAES